MTNIYGVQGDVLLSENLRGHEGTKFKRSGFEKPEIEFSLIPVPMGFAIDANALRTTQVFDYESNSSSHSIRVVARDEYNATVEQTFTVFLTDLLRILMETGLRITSIRTWMAMVSTTLRMRMSMGMALPTLRRNTRNIYIDLRQYI